MNCQEAKSIFYPYLDGELSPHQASSLSTHLHKCGRCQRELALVQENHDLLSRVIVPVDPPADLTARIMASLPINSASMGETPVLPEKISRVNGWMTIKNKLSAVWQNDYLKTAMVASLLAGLMLLVNGGGDKSTAPPVAQNNPPVVIAKQDPVNSNSNNIVTLKPEKVPTDVGEVVPEIVEETPANLPEPDREETPKPSTTAEKIFVAQEGTFILPRPLSVQTQVYELPVMELEEKTLTPVLVTYVEGDTVSQIKLDDSKMVYYIVPDADKGELWETELKAASPSRLVSELPLEDLTNIRETPDLADQYPALGERFHTKAITIAKSPVSESLAVNVGSPEKLIMPNLTGLWLTNATGTELIQVAKSGGGGIIKWSPDGKRIAFSNEKGYLFVACLKDKVLIRISLAGLTLASSEMEWTPDSEKLVFLAKKDGKLPLGIYKANFVK